MEWLLLFGSRALSYSLMPEIIKFRIQTAIILSAVWQRCGTSYLIFSENLGGGV